jgi:FkbH-like protein
VFGLSLFVNIDDDVTHTLLSCLEDNCIFLKLDGSTDTISEIKVEYQLDNIIEPSSLNFSISELPSLIELASKTEIHVSTLLIMRIVSKVICRHKILYKALVLDLDETLWPGILAEDGLETIDATLHTEKGEPYIAFMRFVRTLAEELGIFVSLCSRNDASQVNMAIENLSEDVFPLKSQIDCIIANDNDKSENIKAIASQLSILPRAIVFVDDNQIVRDEVRSKLPEVFVPNWKCHSDLITQLNVACIFERGELTINSQNRRKQLRIIHAEKEKNALPSLYVKVAIDETNNEAKRLYAKSNQFKLVPTDINFQNAKSLIFEMFRENGESLGICSAITYTEVNGAIGGILNWAISCRYFEIGLEEFILLFMIKNMNARQLYFPLQFNEDNKRAQQLVDKYYGSTITDECSSVSSDSDIKINYFKEDCNDQIFADLLMRLNTGHYNFQIFYVDSDERSIITLSENTNLKLKE